MQPSVLFRDPQGQHHRVPHGGLIGRLRGAALVLRDPRVSEAHALVSLRGGALHLLTLRGRFALEGRTPTSLELQPGQRIHFARGLALEVVEVHLPAQVLSLRIDDGSEMVPTGVTSLVGAPELRLVSGYKPDAVAVLWEEDGQWRQRIQGQAERDLILGAQPVGAHTLHCSVRPLEQVPGDATRQLGGVAAPLVLVNHHDSVQLHREGQEPVTVTGNPARIIGELVAFGGPVEWETLAKEIWGEGPTHRLRRNLDQTLLRLRRKLEAGRIRPDLVRSDGKGKLELVLADGDRLDDRA